MENIAMNMAGDLSRTARTAIEDMPGRALRDDEQVSVMAFAAHAAPSGNRRAEKARELKAAMDAMDAKAAPVDSDELEQAFDEAMEHVRPRHA
jgi:hypothetical protein